MTSSKGNVGGLPKSSCCCLQTVGKCFAKWLPLRIAIMRSSSVFIVIVYIVSKSMSIRSLFTNITLAIVITTCMSKNTPIIKLFEDELKNLKTREFDYTSPAFKNFQSKVFYYLEFYQPIIIDNVKYDSLLDVRTQFKISRTEVIRRLRSWHYPTWISAIPTHEKRKPPPIIATVDGVEYRKVTDAAKLHQISRVVAMSRFQSPSWPTWNHTSHPKQDIGHSTVPRACSIDGISYKSLRDAARMLNTDPNTVFARINNPNYPNWQYKNVEEIITGSTSD